MDWFLKTWNAAKRAPGFILYVLYDYYKNGRRPEIAYHRAVSSFVALLFMTLLLASVSLTKTVYIPWDSEASYGVQMMNAFLWIVLPSTVLIYVFLPEHKLKDFAFDWDRLQRAKGMLLLYAVAVSSLAIGLSYLFQLQK
jgi:hypothetical protein